VIKQVKNENLTREILCVSHNFRSETEKLKQKRVNYRITKHNKIKIKNRKIMTEKERIEELLHHFRMNQKEFAEKCGFDPDTISSIKRMSHGISKKIAGKILTACPEISKTWLTTGMGEMLKSVNYKSTVRGNKNTTQIGAGNQANSDVLLALQKEEYLEIIREKEKQLAECQLQISRLITIIEQMSKKG